MRTKTRSPVRRRPRSSRSLLPRPPGPPSGGAAAAAAGRRPTARRSRPGVQMFTEGAQCTAQLRLHATAPAAPTSGTPPTAPAAARRPTPTAATPARSRSAPGSASPSGATLATGGTTRRPRHPRLQLVAHHARRSATTDGNACAANDFALVRVAARRRPQGQPVGAVLGRPDRARPTARAAGSQVYSYGNSPACARTTVLSPKTGASLGADLRRLGLRRLHRHPGHPRRLRQRLPRRPGPRHRHPLDRRDRAARRPPTASATSPASSTTPSALRHRAGCGWSRAPSAFVAG